MTNVKTLAHGNDEQMTGQQLDALMTSNSIYLTEPNSSGEIVLWYAADGIAAARLPSGSLLKGTWEIVGDKSCIKWSYAPNTNSCSIMVRRDGQLLLLENGTDRLLGTVKKIVPSNAESL